MKNVGHIAWYVIMFYVTTAKLLYHAIMTVIVTTIITPTWQRYHYNKVQYYYRAIMLKGI
jgi:hypothetical protein